MKIDEIKKGKEYALNQKYGDPRRVKAMGIVTEEEQVWNTVLESWGTRTVRKIRVMFLDPPTDRHKAAKNTMTNVSARDLAAPWSEVGPNIRKRAEQDAAARAKAADFDKRLKKLLGRNWSGYVIGGGHRSASITVDANSAEKLIALAEKGNANA